MPLVIAIDGPAASGKSSVARALARRIGLGYVNSGAMYRAAAWYVLGRGLNPRDAASAGEALEAAAIEVGLDPATGESFIRLDGRAPTEEELRAAEINTYVSTVSSVPAVRLRLTALLRGLARSHDAGVVMEGRDIGSAVFPLTPYKFYIDASPEVRAQRRSLQGGGPDQILARDFTDSTRRTSPLIIAEDAHVIDSSRLTIDGVVGEIIGRLKLKGLSIAV